MQRRLTEHERALLYSIFKATLPYDRIVCKINTLNIGDASITPTGNPYFSPSDYRADFSDNDVPLNVRWVFIHEMTHVWQYYHQIDVVQSVVGLGIRYFTLNKHRSGTLSSYDKAYPYSLRPPRSLLSFNIEEQAAIVADYWYMTQSRKPYWNTDPTPNIGEFTDMVAELQHSGPPRIPSVRDYDGAVFDGGDRDDWLFNRPREPVQRSINNVVRGRRPDEL